jgi:hypothetical protein
MGTDSEDLVLEDLDTKPKEDDETLNEIEEELDDEDIADDIEDVSNKNAISEEIANQVAELEASNKGLVKALAAQRGIRQDLQAQLDDIKNAINSVKATKSTTGITSTVQKKAIPIDFDENGNPYLDSSKLSTLQQYSPEVEALQQEINMLKQSSINNRIQQAEQESLKNLLSENKEYSPAYKKVTDAWNFLKDDLFDAYLLDKDIPAPKTAEAAIEIALNAPEVRTKFEQKFPGVDLESVMEAHLMATPRYLRKALNKAIQPTKSSTNSNKPLDYSRPASLATANTSGGENHESLLSRIADMSYDDFQALDKTTMSKIDRLLAARG